MLDLGAQRCARWASDHPGLGDAAQFAALTPCSTEIAGPALEAQQCSAAEPIARMIESGPILAARGVVRRRLIDLARWIYEEFRSKKLLRAWTKLRATSRAPAWD